MALKMDPASFGRGHDRPRGDEGSGEEQEPAEEQQPTGDHRAGLELKG